MFLSPLSSSCWGCCRLYIYYFNIISSWARTTPFMMNQIKLITFDWDSYFPSQGSDKKYSRNASDNQHNSDDSEQESKASSYFITAKQKLVSSTIHHKSVVWTEQSKNFVSILVIDELTGHIFCTRSIIWYTTFALLGSWLNPHIV